MAALYITSSQTGAGKTMVCAGVGRYLQDKGKKVGFFKPLVADIKGQAADSDAAFIKRVLSLKEPLEDICPVADSASGIKKAYDKVAKGKDVVIIEGVWRQRPGAKAVEASAEAARALDAKVIAVEVYTPDATEERYIQSYGGFGEQLLGVVLNKVPASRVEAVRGQCGVLSVLGVLPEDRKLLGMTVAELAERIEGKILNDTDKSAELVENFMLGALTVDSGLDYFGRKADKAVVVRAERPDMQLAALETSTRCLVISGDGEPTYTVLKSAREKGIPIVVTGGDTASVVGSIEQALGMTKFNQENKLPRLDDIVQRLDFEVLNKGLGMAG